MLAGVEDLLGRMPVFAGLTDEARGALAGRLSRRPERRGSVVFTEGEPDGLWPVTPDPREHDRRSLYLFTKRNVRLLTVESALGSHTTFRVQLPAT